MKKGYVRPCRRFTLAGLCALISIASISCGTDREREAVQDSTPQTMGSLGLALTGTASSGNVYRLRDGVFSILGESTGYSTTVSTEDDPNLPTIQVQVPADTYSVFLHSGYRLERIDESDGSAPDYRRLAKHNPELRRNLLITPEGKVRLNENHDAIAPIPVSTFAPRLPAITVPVAEVVVRPPTVPIGSGDDIRPMDPGDSTDHTDLTGSNSIDAGAPDATGEVDGGVALQYALVSENPAFVEVEPYGTAFVSFRFLVGEGVIDTQPGAISIGIEVEELAEDCTDAFEPNDTSEQAAPLATNEVIDAIACVWK